MDGTIERELKLEAPETFSLARLGPRLDPYVASPVEWHRLHTVYYDTEDLRLTRWGCGLRYRLHEGWTLKLPIPQSSNALYREEHTFEGGPDAIPADALDLAAAYLRGAMPKPVLELRTLRTKRHLCSDGGDDLAEIVEDDVRVVDGSRVLQRFREVEIELCGGASPETLDLLAKRLRCEGAGRPDPTPKNVRALGPRAREPEIVVPRLGARSRAEDVVRAALAGSAERLIRNDAKLRLAADAEVVHQSRVAVRRLRSDLRSFALVLERAWACALRERLRWIGDHLSAARDADVLLARLERESETLPEADRRCTDDLLVPFREAREGAYRGVGEMLRDARYIALLDEIVDAARRPVLDARANDCACDIVAPLMDEAWKSLRKAVRKRSRPPADRELHRIRIKAKRVRYAAEALSAVVGRRARTFARRVEQLQTILGEHNDAVVAERRLRTLAERPERAFLAGELVLRESEAALDARKRWRKAWRKASRKRDRFWT